ncbi:competence protein CoiA [Bacillus sp. USDA818B3_A]|uniref:competence protein CoiA n=1 Tax=Bacillus sp. USDA818B3_A TaxID=2698834 RepID=UPI00136FAEF1|nr:competence protein CoiA family protein [Bacillus sp. USDA818B3_A]
MLTAITKTGRKVCLGLNFQKETLILLRKKEKFICPICNESVVLKLGDHRIFHFAHINGSQCRNTFENETLEHLEGKRQLFQWLMKQKIPAELEFYDRQIQQRPDIMFKYKGQRYALEFQCSTLPDKIFNKRTHAYLDNGYKPLWIMSGKHIQQRRKDLLALSNFHYSFLRPSSSGRLYIPAYSTEQQLFLLVESITPFSIKNSFVDMSTLPIQSIELNSILEPIKNHSLSLTRWNKEMEKFIFNWALHPNVRNKLFLQEIYHHGLNLFLLPPEIGLPVTHSFLLETPPFIWQTYIFLDLIANKKPGDYITLKEVNASFQKRIYKKQITTRTLPQLRNIQPITAFIEYLQLLEKLKILSRKEDEVNFRLTRMIILPRSNSEREQSKQFFLEKNNHILFR